MENIMETKLQKPNKTTERPSKAYTPFQVISILNILLFAPKLTYDGHVDLD